MEYFRNLMKLLACRYGRAAFFCPRMMDSCTAIADNQSASSSDYYFLFLPVLQHTRVNANNRFRTRLLKCIDILVAIRSSQRPRGKENKNLSPHNVSPHNIIAALSSLWVQKRATVLPFLP